MVVQFDLTLNELCFLNKVLLEKASDLLQKRDSLEKDSSDYLRLSKEYRVYSDLESKLFY